MYFKIKLQIENAVVFSPLSFSNKLHAYRSHCTIRRFTVDILKTLKGRESPQPGNSNYINAAFLLNFLDCNQ